MEEEVITLDEVINLYLDSIDAPDSKYRRISSLGVRALRYIHTHATANPVMIELDLQSDGTIKFPDACLNILRVCSDPAGHFDMVRDDTVGMNEQDCNCPQHNHEAHCPLWAERISYRLDKGERTIYFHPTKTHGSVFVEYIPLIENDGVYVVDPLFVECVIAFIGWNDKLRPQGERDRDEKRFYNELRIGKRSTTPLDLHQAYIQFKKHYKVLTS